MVTDPAGTIRHADRISTVPPPPLEPEAQQLAALAQLDDDTYRRAVLHILDKLSAGQPTDTDTATLRHPALRRRTRHALAGILTEADRQDRRGAPDHQRELWRARRQAARTQRDALPEHTVDPNAAPGRRALQRLAEKYPHEWAELRRGGSRSLRDLARRHVPENIKLRREERGY